ncbi:PucR family transcriptional regulator, partial [Kibdelosporangium aridum subsp. largum]
MVDRVGPTLLRTVLPSDRGVTDVVIAELGRRTHVADGDLVLGVTVNTAGKAAELVEYCGAHGAAAVLKPPLASSAGVLTAARDTGTAVVEVHNATAWAQLVWLLRAVLDAAADDEHATEPGNQGPRRPVPARGRG